MLKSLQNFFQLLFEFFGVLAIFYFTTYVYLMYTDPVKFAAFTSHTTTLVQEIGTFIQILISPLPF